MKGRPPLPKGTARQVFALRLTAAERTAIEDAAKLARMPVTQWARMMILQSCVPPYFKPGKPVTGKSPH